MYGNRKILAGILILVFALVSWVLPVWSQGSEDNAETTPSFLAGVNSKIFKVLFFDVTRGSMQIDEVDRDGSPVLDGSGTAKKKTIQVPFIVLVLMLGAIFFTFWYRWINIRGFKHAIDVIRGKYDKPEDTGEISHFRALTSALSATVGLGNIAGVAVAIQLGGPGAVFWMLIAAVFGMTAKFSSCTLSQMYRKINTDGTVSGGPMYYLDIGLSESRYKGLKVLGKVLAVMYALMIMGGAIGGGNMFQANQTAEAFASTFEISDTGTWNWITGITLAIGVGVVIIGGIKRIGAATSKIVPFMCGIYVLASIFIILTHISQIPETIRLIFTMAFTKNAYYGGFFGVLIMGVRRAAFSNEAGLGSAAIAHAAAKTEEPVREGMIGPFIDTIIVCSMTAMVVIITGTWNDPSISQSAGVTLTTEAFGSAISWFPYILTLCIGLFAYSTMISWCYYGERGWIYLLDHIQIGGEGYGLKTVVLFRIIFVIFIVVGAVSKLSDVLDFSDAMIFSMAFPNIVGSIFLAPKVLEKVRDYWGRYQSGEMSSVESN